MKVEERFGGRLSQSPERHDNPTESVSWNDEDEY